MDHITPLLRTLHWLPVSFRTDFKVLLLVYKALNNLAPPYIRDFLSFYVPARSHHSIRSSSLAKPSTSTVSMTILTSFGSWSSPRTISTFTSSVWSQSLKSEHKSTNTVCVWSKNNNKKTHTNKHFT